VGEFGFNSGWIEGVKEEGRWFNSILLHKNAGVAQLARAPESKLELNFGWISLCAQSLYQKKLAEVDLRKLIISIVKE
jgi:hypothetical protein